MRQHRLNKTQRRKIKIFVKCVVVSFLAWLLIAISNKYTFVVKAGIEFVNIPEKRAFHSLQSDTVSVKIKMSGWDVLLSTLNPDTANIQVDLSSLSSRNYIVFSNQIGFINRQFPSDKQVITVSPDTLYFDFSRQTQRKVPVRVPTSITFRKQYDIIGETKTNPSHITITGPLEDVANIEYLETDSITGKGIHTDIRTVASINKNQRTNITIYPKFTEVTIPVGEVTEKIIEVPIRIINGGKYSSVRIIPTKAVLTIMVSLKDYAKFTASDFEVVVNMADWEKNKTVSLPVLVTKVPDYVKMVKLEPQNVDFFVRK